MNLYNDPNNLPLMFRDHYPQDSLQELAFVARVMNLVPFHAFSIFLKKVPLNGFGH